MDVGGEPEYLAVAPDGRTAYVTNAALSALSVIDIETGAVVATVPVGSGPQRVTVSPDGTRAYVANLSSSSVSVVDTGSNAVVATEKPPVMNARPPSGVGATSNGVVDSPVCGDRGVAGASRGGEHDPGADSVAVLGAP